MAIEGPPRAEPRQESWLVPVSSTLAESHPADSTLLAKSHPVTGSLHHSATRVQRIVGAWARVVAAL
ncbi:hypothetical protein M404DRAFT_999005, partial [Pisolithus tinctorius Marx 270]